MGAFLVKEYLLRRTLHSQSHLVSCRGRGLVFLKGQNRHHYGVSALPLLVGFPPVRQSIRQLIAFRTLVGLNPVEVDLEAGFCNQFLRVVDEVAVRLRTPAAFDDVDTIRCPSRL